MEIVPQDDELIVNAQVSPTDIDNVKVGQTAELRLTALNVRSTPSIYGVVASISGDRIQPGGGGTTLIFLLEIQILEDEKKKTGRYKVNSWDAGRSSN